MQYYMDAILRLDEERLRYFVEAGYTIPEDVVDQIIMSFGPLTEDILWEQGTGDAEADEKLLREVDAKKARMIQYLIGKRIYFGAEELLHCYTMRCVEVARVLLEAGANPNGDNLCSNSTLWMLRDGMKMYDHSPGCWKILTELERLLLDWGAVEFTFEHACIYYEAWQIACCCEPFRVGQAIKWSGRFLGIRDEIVRQYVDFREERDGMYDEYLIRGKITHIYAETDLKEKHAIYKKKADRRLRKVSEAVGFLEHPTLNLWGYYVYLTDVEVDYNPNCERPYNQRMKHALDRRHGIMDSQTI